MSIHASQIREACQSYGPGVEPARPFVSVVIPVHGRPAELSLCLECLDCQQDVSAEDWEIVVSDDGSPELVSDQLRVICEKYPRVRYVRQTKKGPAAARNNGVRHSKGEIIAFTDSDTLPSPGWLEALIAPFADDEVVGVEGPVRTPRPAQSPLEEAPRSEGGVYLTANIAYRKNVLVAVGGLDESFPLAAFEDTDIALCMQKQGKIVFAKNAEIIHPWRKVTLQSSIRRLAQFDWLLVTALRHGCLGWIDRPTRNPRLRIAYSACFALPAGRFLKGLKCLPQHPADASKRMGIAIVEALLGLLLLPRWLFMKSPKARGNYLSSALEKTTSPVASRHGLVPPKLAIVVVNYQTPDETAQCVKSLETLDYVSTEVIVVENASNDDSGRILEELLPETMILQARENNGYTGGNNLGIDEAINRGADYILVINPDTTVHRPSFASELIRFMEAHRTVGAVGPRVFLREVGNLQNTILRFPWVYRRLTDWIRNRVGMPRKNRSDVPVEAEALNGVCVLFRTSAIVDVGCFDENTFAYIEDIDWAYRAKQKGWRTVFLPIDSIIHSQKETGYQRGGTVDFLLKRNTLYFLMKTGHWFQAGLYSASIFLQLGLGRLIHRKIDAKDWREHGARLSRAIGQLWTGQWDKALGRPTARPSRDMSMTLTQSVAKDAK